MARRKRVELAAIASLDAESEQFRRISEQQVQQAYEKLRRRRSEGGSSHDRYLNCLRGFYEEMVEKQAVETFSWSKAKLQAFIGRFFVSYCDPEAFESLWVALVDGGSQLEENGRLVIPSFEVLKDALRRDTATRLAEHDAFALEEPITSRVWWRGSSRGHADAQTELQLPLLTFHGKRPRPSETVSPYDRKTVAPPVQAAALVPSRVSISGAAPVSEGDASSWLEEDDDEYIVPSCSVVVPSEFSAEVAKKSQNWLGRWRTRYLFLRWNELEMRKKNVATAYRHGVARSFPSQPAMSTPATTAITSNASATVVNPQSSPASPNSKRYSLQNLISIQFIQLNESEPVRKSAVDLHFKQQAASGHGHTTKSLILASDKGFDSLKKIVSVIATFALFRALVWGENPQSLQRFVQAGANVNAFCIIPSTRLSVPLSSLQLALIRLKKKPDSESDLATLRLLLDAKADPRSLLHWHFARRSLLSSGQRVDSDWMPVDLLVPTADSRLPVLRISLTSFGSDEHGWTLLMFMALLGDVTRTKELLRGVGESVQGREDVLRYIEHVNGNGDNALHIAIKAASIQKDHAETVALVIADFTYSGLASTSATSALFYTSDAIGETVLHLALKAKMWQFVSLLLKHQAFDPHARDRFGNNALHLAIKVGAPQSAFVVMVQHYKSGAIDEGLEARDRAENATPLMLAVLYRRDELVKILVDAGTHRDVVGGAQEEVLVCTAIRLGLPAAARCIWGDGSSECVPTRTKNTSVLALAIRYGMYGLAKDIIDDQSSRHHIKKDPSWWVDDESRYPAVVLAVTAGQLELAALMIDASGADVFAMQNDLSGESLLHALAVLGAEHTRESDGVWELPTARGRRSRVKSKSDGDLDDMSQRLVDEFERVGNKRIDRLNSAFIARVVEELFCDGLVSVPTVDVVTAVVGRKISTLPQRRFRHSRQSMHKEHSREEPVESSPSADTYTIIHEVAGGLSESSLQLLFLALAGVRLKQEEMDTAVMLHAMVSCRAGLASDTPIHVALSRGLCSKAFVLLHHALSYTSASEGSCGAGEGIDDWISAGGTTLLHLACRYPNDSNALMIADHLLQEDVYAGAWDSQGMSPLHVAIRHQCDARMLQVFKKQNQDLNVWSEATSILTINGSRVTVPLVPLMVAIEWNNVVAFRELIRCGAEYRVASPQHRVGLLQYAARKANPSQEIIDELLRLTPLHAGALVDAEGMTAAEAAEMLRSRYKCRDQILIAAPTYPQVPSTFGDDIEPPPTCPLSQSIIEDGIEPAAATRDEAGGSNRILRITLLGLQTPTLDPVEAKPIPLLPPLSPSRDARASFPATPPRSPSRSRPPDDTMREGQLRSSPERPPRERSAERSYVAPVSKPHLLEQTVLVFLRGEERSTLTLVAQEARAEAQEWLKKRSGQKKLLSEARAQLQTAPSHRRTPSGTDVICEEPTKAVPQKPVTDAQLLETYTALAAKRFIDKHVADVVADARAAIEREKQAIYQETGIFPGEIPFSTKPKDHSYGSSSAASTTRGVHRTASANGSMLLLSTRSYEASEPGNDYGRDGVTWWSDHGGTIFGDDDSFSQVGSGTFLSEGGFSNGTLLSNASGQARPASQKEVDDEILNPLDRDSFRHVIEKRKSLS